MFEGPLPPSLFSQDLSPKFQRNPQAFLPLSIAVQQTECLELNWSSPTQCCLELFPERWRWIPSFPWLKPEHLHISPDSLSHTLHPFCQEIMQVSPANIARVSSPLPSIVLPPRPGSPFSLTHVMHQPLSWFLGFYWLLSRTYSEHRSKKDPWWNMRKNMSLSAQTHPCFPFYSVRAQELRTV